MPSARLAPVAAPASAGITPAQRLILALAVVAAEVALVLWVYKFDTGGLIPAPAERFCPLLTGSEIVCEVVRRSLQSVLFALFAVTVFLGLARGGPISDALVCFLAAARFAPGWLALNAAGLAALLAPYAWLSVGGSAGLPGGWGFAVWLFGIGAVAAGLAGWFAPWAAWRRLAGWRIAALVAGALALPALARGLGSLAWAETGLQQATFSGVLWLLQLIGAPVEHDAGTALIRINDFAVLIEHSCSGLSGIALTAGVLLGYAMLMREQLRTGRVLAMLPLVIAASWGFNVLRVAALVVVGAVFSPELAVSGFHYYAGWIAFVAVSGGMILMLDRARWLQRAPAPQGRACHLPPLRQDPVAGQILPFFILVSSGLLSGAFFEMPALGYPLKAGLTGLALILLLGALPALPRRIDPAAVAVGIGIAMVWLAVLGQAEPASRTDLIGALPAAAALAWTAIRLIGTAVIVPLAEELFFRRYLLERLRIWPGRTGVIVAALASSALFGALHGVFWLAALSGLAFVWVARRRGEIWDAVAAHATANLIIGLTAVAADNYALI